jgi:serine protease
VGTVFVLLVDPATQKTASQRVTNQADEYRYEFSEVPIGSYFVVAGTDADGDGLICESGEFCGAFPVVDEPRAVAVDEGQTAPGVDFPLTFLDFSLSTNEAGGGTPLFPQHPRGVSLRPARTSVLQDDDF